MQLYTVQEVANKLRVSRSKVYNWCATGKISHYKLDGSLRISEEQVQQFLEEHNVEEVKCPPPRPTEFTILDSGRLLEAWKQQGALDAQQDGDNAPSSG